MFNVVFEVSFIIKDQIKGVVFFGYIKNQQNNGGIFNFLVFKMKVYCNIGDVVCCGIFYIVFLYFYYMIDVCVNVF